MAEGGLDIDLYRFNGINYMDLDGEMNEDNCIEVRDMLLGSMAAAAMYIVDLSRVRRMDDTSLATMASLVQEARMMESKLYFVNPHPNLRTMINRSEFLPEACLPTRADAQQAFGIDLAARLCR